MTCPFLPIVFCKFSGESAARMRPSRMIRTRLQVISTSGRMWLEIKTVCRRPNSLIKLAHGADLAGIQPDGRLVKYN